MVGSLLSRRLTWLAALAVASSVSKELAVESIGPYLVGQYTIYCPVSSHNYPDYAIRAGISRGSAPYSMCSSDSDMTMDFKSLNSDLEELD